MDNTTNDTNEKIIIIYKCYSLAQKKASAKYYNANKDKCIARSSKWAIEHKTDTNDKEKVEIDKIQRRKYNQRFYMRNKQKLQQLREQEQEQEQEQQQEQEQT